MTSDFDQNNKAFVCDYFYCRSVHVHNNGNPYSKDDHIELIRQIEFDDNLRSTSPFPMDKLIWRYDDINSSVEVFSWYVDQWIAFKPSCPELHNIFQASYIFDRLTTDLVKLKKYVMAKYYLDYYFENGWDKFSWRESQLKTLRARHLRVKKLLA